MAIEKEKLLFSKILRDSIHNLDTTNVENSNMFAESVRAFVKVHEEVWLEAYDDGQRDPKTNRAFKISKLLASGRKVEGNRTIGAGFNMNAVGARAEWQAAFNGTVSFDDAFNGRLKLTEEQVDRLLEISLISRCTEVKKIYSQILYKLKANEQLAIISAYFNCPAVVSGKSKFHAYIKAYVETADEKYLQAAVEELRYHSNKEKSNGIKERRNCEAELLDSTKAPFYSKPNQSLYPKSVQHVKLNDTVIPRGFDKVFPKSNNSDYFIWRTKLDPKVRKEHLEKEGRIFKRNSLGANELPGQAFNCRCWEEAVTQNIVVVDEKSLSYFIRYGKPGVYYEIEGLW